MKKQVTVLMIGIVGFASFLVTGNFWWLLMGAAGLPGLVGFWGIEL